jgi:hypothetical protein
MGRVGKVLDVGARLGWIWHLCRVLGGLVFGRIQMGRWARGYYLCLSER